MPLNKRYNTLYTWKLKYFDNPGRINKLVCDRVMSSASLDIMVGVMPTRGDSRVGVVPARADSRIGVVPARVICEL